MQALISKVCLLIVKLKSKGQVRLPFYLCMCPSKWTLRQIFKCKQLIQEVILENGRTVENKTERESPPKCFIFKHFNIVRKQSLISPGKSGCQQKICTQTHLLQMTKCKEFSIYTTNPFSYLVLTVLSLGRNGH